MTRPDYSNTNFMYPVADLNATMRLNLIAKTTKRIARKKGQPAGSDKHSDLYTDENPKGTIHGLKFATVQDAKDSVKKIEGSGKTHAHKIQAAIAMEQRARVMGKIGAADVYRAYIEKMKKITKQKNEDFTQRDVNDLEKFADRILKKYNIDVEFTRHFVDRLNDPRNSPAIKVSELQRFFKKIQRNKGIGILSSPDIEAVLKDMETNLNLPVVIKKKGNEFQVLNKTIMRKPNFKTTSKVIRYEKAPDTSDAMKRYKAGKAGFTDIAHLKAKGLIARSDGEKKKSAKYN